MSFGNPIFLWALLAVPLPVLLHLFFRRRKAKVAFSTLQFFHPRKRYLAHRRRLRELLLLLIRTLALLCLVLALSRVLFQSTPYALAAKTNAVIVLDDTLSMDRRIGSGATAFELASQKAEEVLDTLAEGDGAALVLVSGRQGLAMTRKRTLVRQRLQEARVTGATGSYSAALKQAVSYLTADGNPNREIFVLSDFQKNQAPSKPVALDRVKGLRVYFLPVSGPVENLSVQELKLSTRPQMVNKRLTLPYKVRNSGETDSETEVSLTVGDETQNTVTLSVPAGETVEGRFDLVPGRAGVLNGSVRLTDRHLTLDNSRSFSINVCENIRVLLLESDLLSRIRPFHFLKLAVDPREGEAANGIQTEQGFVQELSPKALEKFHVVVMANPQALNAQTASLLGRYMANGGALLAFAGSDVSKETFAAFQDARLQHLFGVKQQADFSGLQFKGPLNALNALLQMDLLKAQRVHELTPSASATVLAENRGRPLLVEEKVGNGRFLACALSCRRDYSNWPELKSFPIALIHLLTYAAHDPQQNAGAACGGRLAFTALSPTDKTIPLRHSDGTPFDLAVENGEAVFTDTWQPGVLTAERASPRCVAVNPVPAESDLACLGTGRMTGLVDATVTVLKTDAGVESQIRTYRQGSDLTGLFLLFTLLLLLLELLVGNTYLLNGLTSGVSGMKHARTNERLNKRTSP
jgi:hypothetical protein